MNSILSAAAVHVLYKMLQIKSYFRVEAVSSHFPDVQN